ncbi:MAG: hypothetical protein R6T91_07970 [Bacteroidales bacterium]
MNKKFNSALFTITYFTMSAGLIIGVTLKLFNNPIGNVLTAIAIVFGVIAMIIENILQKKCLHQLKDENKELKKAKQKLEQQIEEIKASSKK